MHVAMARKLAQHGFASVRIDVSGIGDSAIWKDAAQNHPYADRLVTDVRALVAHLKARGRAENFGVVGLCSGAFVAYHSALADPAITSIVLINLQIFEWEEGMSLEVNPLTRRDRSEYYKRRLFTKEIWLRMLRGEVEVRRALEDIGGSVVDRARGRIARLLARLPNAAARGSQVARAFDRLSTRGVDTLLVFSGSDPGIDNLNEKVGASLRDLTGRPNFTIATIADADHSFTPLWAQAELDDVIVGHLVKRFR
jgi:pimeloyl-ACP methyl ester carboxylesterase